ncbi:unnamed protein product [Periconia digitata]|uniref:Uncharacterized protein n=1 Tax=Periconia digitata TaxID=1303443 RepID=A0A9W4XXV7_9PLEO|nr:unnamed protein product [Periconia digitata]
MRGAIVPVCVPVCALESRTPSSLLPSLGQPLEGASLPWIQQAQPLQSYTFALHLHIASSDSPCITVAALCPRHRFKRASRLLASLPSSTTTRLCQRLVPGAVPATCRTFGIQSRTKTSFSLFASLLSPPPGCIAVRTCLLLDALRYILRHCAWPDSAQPFLVYPSQHQLYTTHTTNVFPKAAHRH